MNPDNPSPRISEYNVENIVVRNVNDAMILSSLNEKDKAKERGIENNFPLENVAKSLVKNIVPSELNK